jgi:hypothetical protein
MLCRANFLSTVSHPLLLLRYQMALVVESGWYENPCCGSRLATCSTNTLNQAMKPY